jgi:hypothetical protein
VRIRQRMQNGVPEGPHGNSPAFQRWVSRPKFPRPGGTPEWCCVSKVVMFGRSFGTWVGRASNPALKRWAIVAVSLRDPKDKRESLSMGLYRAELELCAPPKTNPPSTRGSRST